MEKAKNVAEVEAEFMDYLRSINNKKLADEVEYIYDELVKSNDELLQMKVGILSRVYNAEVINEYYNIMTEKAKYIEYLKFLLHISYDILDERIKDNEASLL